MGIQISSIEYVLGSNLVTNQDLAKEFNFDFSQFEKKVGIKNRYVVDSNTTALDLAVQACEKLFLKYDRRRIDYIIYCTQSPEYFLPTSACILQNKLGLAKEIGAFDFNLGCSGYVYGLSLAKALIVSKQATSVLLVTAETYSKYIHKKDRSNRAIFGDAASATIVEDYHEDLFGKFCFGTDGEGWDKLIVKNGAGRYPFDHYPEELTYGTDNYYSNNNLYMNGPEVFNFTQTVVPKLIEEVLRINEIEKEDIDQFILHQANAFMLNYIRKSLNIESQRFFIDFADSGNTVSNTIPIALKIYSSGLNNNLENTVLLAGFGVGLSWCGGLIKINKEL